MSGAKPPTINVYMQLDKRAAKLLKILKRQTPMPEQTPQQVREAMLKNGNPFAPPAAELSYTKDHTVEVDGAQLLLREYSAVAAGTVSPCILFFHGGGFVFGSVPEYDTVCGQLAQLTGARVFSLEYRRAPEVKYPTPHRDAYATYQWLLTQRFALHLTKIAVCGDSAGGNLSASVCLHARDNGIELPALQMLWYPITHGEQDFPSRREFANDYYITLDDLEWILGHLLDERGQANDIYLAPGLCNDLSGLPAALILTAGFDLLRDEGAAYAAQLQAAGVPAEYRCYDDMFHGFISFGGGLAQGMAAIEQTAEFFRRSVAY